MNLASDSQTLPSSPRQITAPINLELALTMAALFQTQTSLRTSSAGRPVWLQLLLTSAIDSGISVVLEILLLQVLVLITATLVVAAIIK